MNRYEKVISEVSRSIVTTASNVSTSIVGIALALVAIISAIPEFVGLWEVSGKWVLALAIAGMGAAVTHTAVSRKDRYGWGAFAGHIVIAEVTIAWYNPGVEMVFPFVTAIGAAVMSLSSDHVEEKKKQDDANARAEADREKDKADRKALNRELKLLKAQAEADAIRNGIVPQVVPKNVHENVHVTPAIDMSTSGRGVSPETQRKQIVDILMDKGETSVSNLMSALDAPRSTVNKRLVELREAGKVVNENRKWAIAPAVIAPVPEIEIHTNGASG